MDQETSNIIIAIGTIIIAISTICQVFMTFLVAKYINKFSIQSEKVENVKYINEQWQRFNLFAVTNRDFSDVLGEIEYGSKNVLETRKKYIIFYIINILYDVYHAQYNENIPKEFSESMINYHANILKCAKPIVFEIIDNNKGYSLEFSEYLKNIINN